MNSTNGTALGFNLHQPRLSHSSLYAPQNMGFAPQPQLYHPNTTITVNNTANTNNTLLYQQPSLTAHAPAGYALYPSPLPFVAHTNSSNALHLSLLPTVDCLHALGTAAALHFPNGVPGGLPMAMGPVKKPQQAAATAQQQQQPQDLLLGLHDLPDRYLDIAAMQAGPFRCDAATDPTTGATVAVTPTIAAMKRDPSRYAALLVGQLPPAVPATLLLAVFQRVLVDAGVSPDPVIYAFHRFKPIVGTLWVPSELYRDIKEALDCRIRLTAEHALLYATATQPETMGRRRITCEVKHNIQGAGTPALLGRHAGGAGGMPPAHAAFNSGGGGAGVSLSAHAGFSSHSFY